MEKINVTRIFLGAFVSLAIGSFTIFVRYILNFIKQIDKKTDQLDTDLQVLSERVKEVSERSGKYTDIIHKNDKEIAVMKSELRGIKKDSVS